MLFWEKFSGKSVSEVQAITLTGIVGGFQVMVRRPQDFREIWENVILRTSHHGFEPVFNTTDFKFQTAWKMEKKYKQTLINLSLLTLHVNVDYRHLDNLLSLSHVL